MVAENLSYIINPRCKCRSEYDFRELTYAWFHLNSLDFYVNFESSNQKYICNIMNKPATIGFKRAT